MHRTPLPYRFLHGPQYTYKGKSVQYWDHHFTGPDPWRVSCYRYVASDKTVHQLELGLDIRHFVGDKLVFVSDVPDDVVNSFLMALGGDARDFFLRIDQQTEEYYTNQPDFPAGSLDGYYT